MTHVSVSGRGPTQSSSLRHLTQFGFNARGVCVAGDLPEVAPFGVNETDSGVLLVGVRGAELLTVAGNAFKLHTHWH